MGSGHVRSAALSQKAALQMPFAVYDPSRENSVWSAPQSCDKREIINILSAEDAPERNAEAHSKSSRPLVFIISLLTTNRTLP